MDVRLVFIYVAAIGLGVAPVLWTGRLRKRYAEASLPRFQGFLLISSLTILANLVIRHIGPRMDVVRPDQVLDLSMLFGLMLVPALIAMSLFFIRWAYALLQKPVPRTVGAVFAVFWGLFFAGFIFSEVSFFRTGSMAATRVFETIFDAGLAVFFGGALVLLLAGAAGLEDPARRSLARTLALAYLIVLLLPFLAPALDLGHYAHGTIIMSLAFLFFHIGVTAFLASRISRLARPDEPASRFPSRAAAAFDRYLISPRERDIVLGILEGRSNAEIAGALFISERTVETHIRNVYQKTGVRNRVQLLNLFREDPAAYPP
jgi:DNA-binding CsgD family transcriptional regulator